jgi:hypothetical protein
MKKNIFLPAGIALSVANVAIYDFFLDWRLKSASGA